MAVTREAIMEALLAVLSGTAAFVTISRRNQNPEGLSPASTPALFLIEHEDTWDRRQGYNIAPVRTLAAIAIIYIDTGTNQNAIPSSFINATLESIEAAFVPDNRITNTFTLGGLVQACILDGPSARASGDVTGKGLVVVPIRILIP